MQIAIADAQFNGTGCGIDVTTKVKGMCHNQDRCQLYASSATIGNSGCSPGTATLVIGYSCKGNSQRFTDFLEMIFESHAELNSKMLLYVLQTQ